jgi:hypothetical protein
MQTGIRFGTKGHNEGAMQDKGLLHVEEDGDLRGLY